MSAYLIQETRHGRAQGEGARGAPRTAPVPVVPVVLHARDHGGHALNSASVSTGDVPRELFLCDETRVKQQWPKASGFIPPQVLIDRALIFKGLINDIRQCPEASDKIKPFEVPMTNQAVALLTRIMERCSADEDETNLTGRHWEKVVRAALTVATWGNPKEPRMQVRHVVWAEALVTASDHSVIAYFAGRVPLTINVWRRPPSCAKWSRS